MDKQTLAQYGWIVVAVLIISVMLAMATPFGVYISNAVKSATNGLLSVNSKTDAFLGSLVVKKYTPEEVVELFSKTEPLAELQKDRADFTNANDWNNYIDEKLSAHTQALKAYESLSEEDKAIVKQTMGEENLNNFLKTELETVFNKKTFKVTKGAYEDYHFMAGFYSNRAYEIGTHISYGESGGHPMTIVMVDTNKISGSWSPSGEYVLGESDYDVLYCCESDKPVKHGTYYKKLNIEDADYFGKEEAAMIRAIVMNSYPYISLDEMKTNLKNAGYPYADELTRGDIITAVQFAIWRYSNASYKHIDGIDQYGETTNNTQLSYAKSYHDYTNELWHWWASGKNATYYDATAEVKINSLVNYLASRQPIYAGNENRIITDMDLISSNTSLNSNGTWNVSLTIELNGAVKDGDNVKITVKNANGELYTIDAVAGQKIYTLNFTADDVNNMTVAVSGTQNMATDAYLYMPYGGKEVSQVLVGVSNGSTTILTEMTLYTEE